MFVIFTVSSFIVIVLVLVKKKFHIISFVCFHCPGSGSICYSGVVGEHIYRLCGQQLIIAGILCSSSRQGIFCCYGICVCRGRSASRVRWRQELFSSSLVVTVRCLCFTRVSWFPIIPMLSCVRDVGGNRYPSSGTLYRYIPLSMYSSPAPYFAKYRLSFATERCSGIVISWVLFLIFSE